MRYVLIALFSVLIVMFGIVLLQDLFRNGGKFKQEPGKMMFIALATAAIQFLATFGISDFNVSIPLYRGAKWVDDRRMPGTLMVATVIPGALISIIYISGNTVALATLLCCLIAQSLGSLIGGKLVSGLKENVIRAGMLVAILASIIVIVAKQLFASADNGVLNGFPIHMLIWIVPVYFFFGVINTLGFGVKAISMALLLTMGLSPQCVLPIVLSCCCLGSFFGGVQFVQNDCYQRKIAVASSTAGTVGVVLGASFVKALPVNALQWIMVIVLGYTAVTMLMPKKK